MKAIGKAYLVLWIVLSYVPFLLLVLFSLNSTKYITKWEGFSLVWYKHLFESSVELSFLQNSLTLALLTVLVVIPMGTLTGLFVDRQITVVRRYLRAMVLFQVIVPEIIFGISLAVFFSFLSIPLSFYTLLVAHVTFCLGFFVLSFVSQLDASFWTYERAAKDLGAVLRVRLMRVLLPLLTRPILASTFLVVALSLDNYIISFFTAGPAATTFPNYLFASLRQGIAPVANAGAVLLVIIMFVLTMSAIRVVLSNQTKNTPL